MIGRGWKKGKRGHHWQESKISYEFDNEMNGTQLIRNFNWLGRMNNLIEKMEIKENNSSSVDEINEDEDEDRKKRKLLACGSSSLRKKLRDNNNGAVDERDLRHALPEMNNTLSNWTLDGQNLGSMMANYQAQCRNMTKKQRNKLAHFFKTTSNILDTIGSITENTISRSVKFDKDLVGGSMEKKKAISHKPPKPLFPSKENLSRYAAVFPGYSIDRGNVLDVGKHMSDKIFSADYPQYPLLKSLMVNPALPVEEKFYSTNDDESTSSDEGDITSYLSYDDDDETNDDSDTNKDDSYV